MNAVGWLAAGIGVLSLRGVRPAVHPHLQDRLTPTDVSGRADRGPPDSSGLVRRLRRRDAAAGLLAAVRLLASELAAGARPADALGAAAAIDPHHRAVFERAAATQHRGGDAASVLRSVDAVAFVGHAWAVAAATGAAPAEVLARAASDCAGQLELRRAVATALAGARASAAVMAALPLLGIVLGTAMGARPLPTLIGSAGGRVCAVLGVLLDVAGIAWTRAIARRAARP